MHKNRFESRAIDAAKKSRQMEIKGNKAQEIKIRAPKPRAKKQQYQDFMLLAEMEREGGLV